MFEITKESDKGVVVKFTRTEFANCKKDIGTGVVCKVEKGAYSKAERELRVLFFNNQLVMIGGWAVVFAEDIIRSKRGFALRELGLWVVALQRVENITVLIKSVRGIFVLVDAHLQEPLCKAKEFHVETVSDRIIECFLNGIVASNIWHVINKE